MSWTSWAELGHAAYTAKASQETRTVVEKLSIEVKPKFFYVYHHIRQGDHGWWKPARTLIWCLLLRIATALASKSNSSFLRRPSAPVLDSTLSLNSLAVSLAMLMRRIGEDR